jgi:hypothetical protein
MKLKLFILLCISFNYTNAQLSLEIRAKSLDIGTVYLWNTNSEKVDTLTIKDGAFKIKYDLNEPTLFYLKVDKINEFDLPIRLLLSSQTTSLYFNTLARAVRGYKFKDLYPNEPEYINDPNQNYLLRKFESKWIIFSDSITSLTDNNLEEKTLLEKRKSLYDAYIQENEKMIDRHSDKFASAVALYEFLIRNNLIDLEKIKQLYGMLNDPVKYSLIGQKIGYHINKQISLKPGSKPPNFRFANLHGKEFTANDFKGRKILLHFWASTCGPCRLENRDIH